MNKSVSTFSWSCFRTGICFPFWNVYYIIEWLRMIYATTVYYMVSLIIICFNGSYNLILDIKLILKGELTYSKHSFQTCIWMWLQPPTQWIQQNWRDCNPFRNINTEFGDGMQWINSHYLTDDRDPVVVHWLYSNFLLSNFHLILLFPLVS